MVGRGIWRHFQFRFNWRVNKKARAGKLALWAGSEGADAIMANRMQGDDHKRTVWSHAFVRYAWSVRPWSNFLESVEWWPFSSPGGVYFIRLGQSSPTLSKALINFLRNEFLCQENVLIKWLNISFFPSSKFFSRNKIFFLIARKKNMSPRKNILAARNNIFQEYLFFASENISESSRLVSESEF